MTAPITVSLVDRESADWPAEVARLRALLGAPDNPILFPPHFLEATFPKIGGQIALLGRAGQTCGVGFLFPRGVQEGRRIYTMRFYAVNAACSGEEARHLLEEIGAT